jgi:hypothetical protein
MKTNELEPTNPEKLLVIGMGLILHAVSNLTFQVI